MSEEQVNNNEVDAFKDFLGDHLTDPSRLIKGYNFEMQIQKSLEKNSLSFNGNPRSFEDWKRFIGKGVDVVIEINNKRFQIECKYNESTVYPSYVVRDYITRFSLNNDFKIVVTNDKWKLTYRARQILIQHHIKLLNDYELVWYLIKKIQHSNRNKYLFLNRDLNSESLTCKLPSCVLETFSRDNFKVKGDSDFENKAEKCRLYRSGNSETKTVLEG